MLRGGTDEAPLDTLMFTALSTRPAGLEGRATDQRYIIYYFARDRSGLRRDRRTKKSADGGTEVENDQAAEEKSHRNGIDVLSDDANDFFAAFGPTPVPSLGTSPHRLLRREATMIERRAMDEARASVFVEGVASLEFRFFDGRDWQETWESEEHNARLPRAVGIDLALYDPSGGIHHFTTAVDLPLSDHVPAFAEPTTPPGTTGSGGKGTSGGGRDASGNSPKNGSGFGK